MDSVTVNGTVGDILVIPFIRVPVITVNGTAVTPPTNTVTLTDVKSDQTINVTFVIQTFEIKATSGEGGSITTTGVNPVPYGGSITFNFVPDANYQVKEVLVDNVSRGAIKTHTFSNVKETHTIDVTFEEKKVGINDVKAEDVTLSYKAGVISIDSKSLKIDKVSVYAPDGRLIAQQQGVAPISIGNYPVVIVALEINGTQIIHKLILQ